jgi:hypothetical protein
MSLRICNVDETELYIGKHPLDLIYLISKKTPRVFKKIKLELESLYFHM